MKQDMMENAATPAVDPSEFTENPEATGAADPVHARMNWLGEAKSLSVLVLLVLAFHSFIAKPFYIPSESMMPLLLKGDRLVVSKYPYGWSYVSPTIPNPAAIFRTAILREDPEPWGITLPFMHGRLLGRVPKRGDVVIVTPRGESEDYIKRVIGLPGDLIELRAGQLIINGVPVPQRTLPLLMIPVDENAPCSSYQFPGALTYGQNGERLCALPVIEERLPNGRKYLVADTGMREHDWYGPIRVPDGQLFLMGDNRDNSADSRFSLAEKGLGGPVPIESVGGRAEFLTFSVDGTTQLNPMSWWRSLRSERSGMSLRPAREK
tara:strand:- start:55689 stop:56654 length:966 start_codon:yes stop_codon:yes gene_type:complete